MTIGIRKLILLLALLVLPLQGLATAATFVKCHEQATTEAAQELGGHDHDQGGSHHLPDSDDGGAGSFVSHLCGHHIALHVPSDLKVATAPAFAAWSAGPTFGYTPYFPEHPRRPPRA